MGLIHKFMPAREEAKPAKLIADLDLLVSQKIGFRYLGRDHVIEPMTTANFIAVVKALHQIEVVAKLKEGDEGYDKDGVYLAYYEFVSSLCSSVSLEDIKEAKLPQLHALMALLIKHIKGETAQDMVEAPSSDLESEKKKMK